MSDIAKLEDVTVAFRTEAGPIYALDRFSLSIAEGERVALVGESGAGKSATALTMMGLLPGHASVSGSVMEINGTDLTKASGQQLRRLRGGSVGMVFQEPMSALNPSMKVGNQVAESLRTHQAMDRSAARQRVIELFQQVEIPSPAERYDLYPHQLSGGMRQRVVICIAIASAPRLLIADEPTTALDVTVQAEILRLFRRLTSEQNMALMLVTHDLGIVAQLADRVCVMYGGRIVEDAPTRDIFRRPQHPYTRGLLESIPSRATGSIRDQRLREIPGIVTVLRSPATACVFAPRCPRSRPDCWEHYPELDLKLPGHTAACFYPGEEGACG